MPAALSSIGSERRRHARFRFEQQLLFRTRAKGAASVARVRDLSRDGLFVETDRAPRPGMIIAGVFRVDPLGKSQPVDFLGEVVRSTRWHRENGPEPAGFAVRFVHLTFDARRRLEGVLADRGDPQPQAQPSAFVH